MTKSAVVPVAVLILALAAPAIGQAETVTGQLVDLACYSQNKANTGNAHRGRGLICAQACAREGFAVGLLTTDGKVYQVTGELADRKNAKLVPYMTQTVMVTGDVSEKDGHMMIAGSDIAANKQAH